VNTLAVVSLIFLSWQAFGAEFVEEVGERTFKLRSVGNLKIKNAKGAITLTGWSQDRIRIRITKKVEADTQEDASRLMKNMDFRYEFDKEKGDIQISNEYGKELSIEERLHVSENPNKIRMDITVFAPANWKLEIWAVNGKVTLKNWGAQAEIRSNSGQIQVEGLKGKSLTVNCEACSASLKNIRASLSCTGGDGDIELSGVTGKSIYAGTNSGLLKLWQIKGDQQYTSKTGSIQGQFLKGKVEFHSQQGSLDLREISGFLSGTVESGNVSATVRDWDPTDKALIESVQGNIRLTLPRRFSGDIDIWSIHGKTALDFALEKSQDLVGVGPEPTNHLLGRIREGGELLKVFTERGDISVSKSKL
jgi:DUF4097 and DUF4098 domain-containing protein YvlB